jgi:hypothetical protein
MHDQPINSGNSSPTLDLDERIDRALETVPEIHVPSDFAARVAARLPASRPASLTPTHYGKRAMLIALVVTLGALLVLATQTRGQASFGLVESLLFAQFLALAVWLSVWRHGLR